MLMMGRQNGKGGPSPSEFISTCGGGLAHAYAISARGAAKSLKALHGRMYDAVDVQWPQWFRGYSYGNRNGGQVPDCAKGWSEHVDPVSFYRRYMSLDLPVSGDDERRVAAYHPRYRIFGQLTQQSDAEAADAGRSGGEGFGGGEGQRLLDPLAVVCMLFGVFSGHDSAFVVCVSVCDALYACPCVSVM